MIFLASGAIFILFDNVPIIYRRLYSTIFTKATAASTETAAEEREYLINDAE